MDVITNVIATCHVILEKTRSLTGMLYIFLERIMPILWPSSSDIPSLLLFLLLLVIWLFCCHSSSHVPIFCKKIIGIFSLLVFNSYFFRKTLLPFDRCVMLAIVYFHWHGLNGINSIKYDKFIPNLLIVWNEPIAEVKINIIGTLFMMVWLH